MADEHEGAGPSDASPEGAERILAQDDIEALLGQARKRAAGPGGSRGGSAEGGVAQQDLDLLLHQAEAALASIDQPSGDKLPDGVTPFRLEAFTGAPASAEVATLELIRDVELDLRIELGRTHMYLEDVLKLRKGSVVPLDKLAGDPVDIYVNGRLIARGEVLVLNDNFCVRVAELLSGERAAG
jgi:flagellar motor switch protein FliN/FliY